MKVCDLLEKLKPNFKIALQRNGKIECEIYKNSPMIKHFKDFEVVYWSPVLSLMSGSYITIEIQEEGETT